MKLYLMPALLMILTSSGCGLLIGNVKPVDERSDSYKTMDLSSELSDWTRLNNREIKADNNSEAPDVAYQSRKTASIISLNSTCRPSVATRKKNLREFTELLLLGISTITQRTEKELSLQGAPALETTVQGTLSGESVTLRTVVLRRQTCLYDITLVARPAHFETDEKVFSQFIASLKLK